MSGGLCLQRSLASRMANQKQEPSRRSILIGSAGLTLGGLAPMVTGLKGLFDFHRQGFFIAKTGEHVDGPTGIFVCVFFVLAGSGMIGYVGYRLRGLSRKDRQTGSQT